MKDAGLPDLKRGVWRMQGLHKCALLLHGRVVR